MKFSDLRTEFETSSSEAFGQKYAHPWLVLVMQSAVRKVGRPIEFTTVEAPRPVILDPIGANADPKGFARNLLLRGQTLNDTLDLRPVVKRQIESGEQAPITVGRAPESDIVIRDRSVSKLHAHLNRTDEGAWVLQAYQSLNGTKVNAEVLEPSAGPAKLLTGTRIEIGNVVCQFIEQDDFLSVFTLAR